MKETDFITINAQSSICFDWKKKIYFDPFKLGHEAHDADYIFFTHEHFDHFSPEDFKKAAKADTVYVAPQSMEKLAREAGILPDHFYGLKPGEQFETGGMAVEAVAAYNNEKQFHPKENGWLGYILVLDGVRYYIAGDTDDTEDNRKVACDVAFIPIGGTYTMDTKEAADFVNAIRPKTVVPIHYGTVVGEASDGEKFREMVSPDIQVEIKLSF